MGAFELADNLSELTKYPGDFIAAPFRMVWSFATIVLAAIRPIVSTHYIYSLLRKLRTCGTERGKGDKSSLPPTRKKSLSWRLCHTLLLKLTSDSRVKHNIHYRTFNIYHSAPQSGPVSTTLPIDQPLRLRRLDGW